MGKEQEFLEACKTGNLATVHKIIDARLRNPLVVVPVLKKKGLFDFKDPASGYTALHQAALNGHSEIVSVLLTNGANPRVQDKKGCVPLHLAAWGGHLEAVRLLIACDTSRETVNFQNHSKEVPLHFAAQHGHAPVVSLLIQNGADPKLRNARGETPLDLAARFGRLEPVKLVLANCPELILSSQADPVLLGSRNSTVDLGTNVFSPLHLAARNGKLDVVRLLLDVGFDMNHVTEQGSALHEAALFGKVEVVMLLLQRGISTCIRDFNGRTVLDVLSEHQAQKSVEITQLIQSRETWQDISAIIQTKAPSSVDNTVPLNPGSILSPTPKQNDHLTVDRSPKVPFSSSPAMSPTPSTMPPNPSVGDVSQSSTVTLENQMCHDQETGSFSDVSSSLSSRRSLVSSVWMQLPENSAAHVNGQCVTPSGSVSGAEPLFVDTSLPGSLADKGLKISSVSPLSSISVSSCPGGSSRPGSALPSGPVTPNIPHPPHTVGQETHRSIAQAFRAKFFPSASNATSSNSASDNNNSSKASWYTSGNKPPTPKNTRQPLNNDGDITPVRGDAPSSPFGPDPEPGGCAYQNPQQLQDGGPALLSYDNVPSNLLQYDNAPRGGNKHWKHSCQDPKSFGASPSAEKCRLCCNAFEPPPSVPSSPTSPNFMEDSGISMVSSEGNYLSDNSLQLRTSRDAPDLGISPGSLTGTSSVEDPESSRFADSEQPSPIKVVSASQFQRVCLTPVSGTFALNGSASPSSACQQLHAEDDLSKPRIIARKPKLGTPPPPEHLRLSIASEIAIRNGGSPPKVRRPAPPPPVTQKPEGVVALRSPSRALNPVSVEDATKRYSSASARSSDSSTSVATILAAPSPAIAWSAASTYTNELRKARASSGAYDNVVASADNESVTAAANEEVPNSFEAAGLSSSESASGTRANTVYYDTLSVACDSNASATEMTCSNGTSISNSPEPVLVQVERQSIEENYEAPSASLPLEPQRESTSEAHDLFTTSPGSPKLRRSSLVTENDALRPRSSVPDGGGTLNNNGAPTPAARVSHGRHQSADFAFHQQRSLAPAPVLWFPPPPPLPTRRSHTESGCPGTPPRPSWSRDPELAVQSEPVKPVFAPLAKPESMNFDEFATSSSGESDKGSCGREPDPKLTPFLGGSRQTPPPVQPTSTRRDESCSAALTQCGSLPSSASSGSSELDEIPVSQSQIITSKQATTSALTEKLRQSINLIDFSTDFTWPPSPAALPPRLARNKRCSPLTEDEPLYENHEQVMRRSQSVEARRSFSSSFSTGDVSVRTKTCSDCRNQPCSYCTSGSCSCTSECTSSCSLSFDAKLLPDGIRDRTPLATDFACTENIATPLAAEYARIVKECTPEGGAPWRFENRLTMTMPANQVNDGSSQLASTSSSNTIEEGTESKESSPLDEKAEWDKINGIFESVGAPMLARASLYDSDVERNFKKQFKTPNSVRTQNNSGQQVAADTVIEWLANLGLSQYEPNFTENGYDSVEFLFLLDDRSLRAIGVTNAHHIGKVLNYLREFASHVTQDHELSLARSAAVNNKFVSDWLLKLDCPEYTGPFMRCGFDTIQAVINSITAEVLTETLGIKKVGHIQRIMWSLNKLYTDDDQFPALLKVMHTSHNNGTHSPIDQVISVSRDFNPTNDQRPPIATEPAYKWRHDSDQLLHSCVLYTAHYLGSTLVDDPQGSDSTRGAMTKAKKTIKLIAKIPQVVLQISYRGVNFTNPVTLKTIAEHAVENIHCVCQDEKDLNCFAYITKEADKHFCHVFSVLTADLATEIILTLGQAFEIAYRMATSSPPV